MYNVNPNNRVLPQLEQTFNPESEASYSIGRVVQAVLPIFALYPPIGRVTQVGTLTFQLVQDICTVNLATFGQKEIRDLVVKVATIASMIFFPLIAVTAHHTYEGGSHLVAAGDAIRAGAWDTGALETLLFAHQAIYVASLFTLQAEILALSILAQAIFEGYKAYQFGDADFRLECIVHLALATLRTYCAGKQIVRVSRNWFGTQLDIKTFRKILRNRHHVGKRHQSLRKGKVNLRSVDLDAEFARRNISNRIENLEFSYETLEGCELHHLYFNRCNFSHSIIRECRFDHVIFHQSNLSDARFIDTEFHHVLFSGTNALHAQYLRCAFDGSEFIDCNLTRSNFSGSRFRNSSFDSSTLEESSFFQTEIDNSTMIDCDLTNTILSQSNLGFTLQGTSRHIRTKPIIALEGWMLDGEPPWVEGVAEALVDQGAVPLRYHSHHHDVNDSELVKEVRRSLSEYPQHPSTGWLSRPDRILRTCSQDGEVAKIVQFSKILSDYADGIVIPGGEDEVHPSFYRRDVANPSDYYHHDMMNFAAIQALNDQNKPFMGVCRGSQVGNVFFGGTIKNVAWQVGEQHLQTVPNAPAKAKEVLNQIVADAPISGYCAHYQASKDLGRGLHTVLEVAGIPEAIVNETGKVILTQFHPETYVQKKEGLATRRFQQIVDRPNPFVSSSGGGENAAMDALMNALPYTEASIEGNANFYRHFLAQTGF